MSWSGKQRVEKVIAIICFCQKKQTDPAIALEVKVGDTCNAAIARIRARNYPRKAREQGAKEIILVGISYNKEKRHCCRIERLR